MFFIAVITFIDLNQMDAWVCNSYILCVSFDTLFILFISFITCCTQIVLRQTIYGLSHIFAVHADEIPVCRRTLYNYFNQSVFKARNIDLPRRVRYKKRKKRSEPRKKNIQQTYRNKRTYVDFEKYTAAFPELGVVEMDTVKGTRAAGKCLLTLLFRSCSCIAIKPLKKLHKFLLL